MYGCYTCVKGLNQQCEQNELECLNDNLKVVFCLSVKPVVYVLF